jgi:two-component system NarL family sensor kinase
MDAKEAKMYFSILIAIALMGAIIFFLAVLIIQQQHTNLELRKANSLAGINAMEKERARIASDLHDDLGPILSVIKFQLGNAIYSSKNQFLYLLKASDQLDEVLMKLRAVSYNLLPIILERKGAFAAIQELIYSLEQSNPLKIFFSYPPLLTMDENQAIQIFRIVQEAVNNVFKHAKAQKMKIIFSEYKKNLVLVCTDDGIGFNINSEVELYKGRGLSSIQNRTDMMDGIFYLYSEKGKGTILTIEIPIK